MFTVNVWFPGDHQASVSESFKGFKEALNFFRSYKTEEYADTSPHLYAGDNDITKYIVV